VLAQLRGQLPEAQIEQAQVSLRQGDTAAARQVFHAVADKAGAAVALAAFQLGQMAEGDLEYAEAMRQYKKAVALEEDNPKYLFAAGNMAREMAEYKQAQEWLEHLLELMENEGDDVKIASAMNALANLYVDQGKYEKAAPMYEHALSVCENYFGKNSMSIICFLENIAILNPSCDL
jgi:tetratricopeptide (TPR) repeat protein